MPPETPDQAPSSNVIAGPRLPVAETRLHPSWDRVLVALFVSTLFVPGVATLFGVDAGLTRGENRDLAKAPAVALTWQSVSALPSGFTAWFQDHFAFRRRLVQWQAAFRLLVLRSSPSTTVLRGKDGWLFYGDDGALDDYVRRTPLSAADLTVWSSTLQHTHDWLAARGIAYLFVVAPDKHEVYPEYMPAGITPLAGPSRTDQLVEHLRAHTRVPVLDLRPVLAEATRAARVYHRTDSHWNDLGAFAAAQAILRHDALSDAVGGLGSLTDAGDSFVRQEIRTPGLDLTRMLGLERWILEDNIQLQSRARGWRLTEPARVDPEYMEGRLATEHVRRDLPRAVIFRDSFGSALVPFLSDHFSRALYLWEYDMDPRVVERERPHVVIQEWAGRRLSTRLPYDALAAMR